MHVAEVAEPAYALVVEYGESGQKAVALPSGQSIGILPDTHH
jgi:hypothetical protein